jgi:hypothetical protein
MKEIGSESISSQAEPEPEHVEHCLVVVDAI